MKTVYYQHKKRTCRNIQDIKFQKTMIKKWSIWKKALWNEHRILIRRGKWLRNILKICSSFLWQSSLKEYRCCKCWGGAFTVGGIANEFSLYGNHYKELPKIKNKYAICYMTQFYNPCYLLKGPNILFRRYFFNCVYSCFIPLTRKWKQPKCSLID